MHDLDAVALAVASAILVTAAVGLLVRGYVAEVKRLLAILDAPDETDPLDDLDWEFPRA